MGAESASWMQKATENGAPGATLWVVSIVVQAPFATLASMWKCDAPCVSAKT
jgi:hypothetical protein